MKKVLCSALSVTLSIAFAGTSMAQVQPSTERAPKPNYDKRGAATNAPLSAEQISGLAKIKSLLPSTVVDFDERLGTPKFIRANDGFLTGQGGEGRAVSPSTAAAFSPNDPDRAVKAFLTEHASLLGQGADALASAKVLRQSVGSRNGLRTVVWNQALDNIPVFEGVLIGNTTRNGELVSLSSQFLSNLAQKADAGTPNRAALEANPSISAVSAIVAAASDIGESWSAGSISAAGAPSESGYQHYSTPRDAFSRLVWLPIDQNQLRLCWEVLLDSHENSMRYQVLVDADSGQTWLRRSLTEFLSDATYNVFTSDSPSPFSPGWSTPNTGQPALTSRTLVTLSALDTNASPAGWIPDGGNTTTGNNADVFLDRNFDGVPDQPRPVGANRVFDFPQDLNQDPTNYIDASTVQMFYWVNWYHDRLYDLGFDEAAGNYQQDNFGRGGIGGDNIIGYVQAGADVGFADNAFFSAAPDGDNGQIFMFIWDGANPNRDGDLDAEVILHEATHGTSERLVGGGVLISALQPSGMGEGWSDFYALSLLSQASDDPDGVYAAAAYAAYRLGGLNQNYYFGLRHYPYSTDMAKNPFTFKDIDPAQVIPHTGVPLSPIYPFTPAEAPEVHHQGEIWCVTLWGMRANLIHKYGPSANLTTLQMVTDAMKLGPANPTFLQARDAIILADRVDNGGQDFLEIWKAFAKRGMGASAVAPPASTTSGVKEAFDLPGLLLNDISLFGGNGNGVIDPNECNSLQVSLFNAGLSTETGISARLSTTTPGVLIAHPVSAYADIPVGATNVNLTDFRISTSPDFICGTPVDFRLVIKSDQETRTNDFRLSSTNVDVAVRFDTLVPVPIPDADPLGASSGIVVSNFSGTIGNLTLSLHITHTFDSDLTLELIAPDGTSTILSANNGGSDDNYGVACVDPLRTVFDDSSTNPITTANAPFIGTYAPEQPLAVFIGKNGTNANGIWRLHAVDDAFGDTGTIDCWSLFLSPAVCTDGGGQCPGVDLAIGMRATPEPVFVGSNLVYSISVTNFGPNTAKNVVMSHVLPPNTIYVSASVSQGNISQAGGIVTANMGALPVGGVATALVTVTPVLPGLISSTASVTSSDPENDPVNNSVTVLSHVNPPFSDMSVGIVEAPNPVLLGASMTYAVSVTNNGPATATGVTVTNLLPVSANVISASPSQGFVTVSGSTVVASFGTLTNGGRATLVITAVPSVEGLVSMSATASANQVDPVQGNNSASITTVVGPSADLALGLASFPPSVVLGSNYTYVITVTNRGPSTATQVTVQDPLPAGVTVVSSTNVVDSSNVLTCAIGAIPPGGTATILFTANCTNLGVVVNSASVAGAQADVNTANNIASVSTVVSGPLVNFAAASALLTAESFSPTNGTVDPGETVTVQLYLKNIGNVPNTNDLVATLLPGNGVTAPSGNPQHYGIIAAGSVANRPFTFTASGTNGGTITATLQLQDNGDALTNVTFTFALPSVFTFANTNRIDIPSTLQDQQQPGPAAPYPSTIAVSGISGLLSHVSVTVSNLTHSYPHDINLLLVSPAGEKVLLMSDAGEGSPVSAANITFDDNGGAALPASGQLTSGSWRIGAYDSAPPFSDPAPAAPYDSALSDFNAPSPNGLWSLYANDDSTGDFGAIAGGWSISFTSVTPVNQIADVSVAATGVPSAVLVGNPVTNIFKVSNTGPNNAASVSFSSVLPAGAAFLSASTSSQAQPVVAGASVSFDLGSLATGSNVTVAVAFVPQVAGSLSNAASVAVASGEVDLNLANNSAAAISSAITPVADLGITASAAPAPVTVASNLTFTLFVTNNGPQNALSVMVTNRLPAGVSLVSSNASQGALSLVGGALVANLGALPNAGTASVSIVVAPSVAGSLTNICSVTTLSTDNQSANNSVTNVIAVVNPAPILLPAGAVLTTESVSPPDGSVELGETVTVSLALTNAGPVDTSAALTATLLAGNGISAPSGPVAYGIVQHHGAKASGSFTFTAAATTNGVITAVLQLQDGANNLGTASFSFALPSNQTLTAPTGITIPDHGPATPYPSTINISGMAGAVGHVTVTLNGLAHAFPDDLDVMLVGPGGQKVILMSDAGGGHPVTNLNLTFDDLASAPLSDTEQLVSGNFQPTDFEPGDSFPPLAPAGAVSANLAAFNGTDPNGAWSLFVVDDSVGDGGAIQGGWTLSVTTIQTVNPVLNLAAFASASPSQVFAGDAITYTFTVTNQGPADATQVLIHSLLPAGCTVISSSSTAGAFNFSGLSGTLTVPLIPAGAGVSGTVVASSSLAGAVTNSFSVNSDETDLDPASNTAQAAATVLVAITPRLSIAPKAAGQFELTIAAQAGLNYAIQQSADLTNWSTVSSGTANGSGILKYVTTNGPSFNRLFFRAVRVP